MDRELKEQLLDKLESIGTLHPRAGMTYALTYFSKLARLGTGMSRREITRATRELSPFIHSWDTFHRYMGICKEFVVFCRTQGANRLHKLHYETVESFLMKKIEKGDARTTIEVNICALQKFFNAVSRGDLRDRLSNDYQRFKYLAREGRTIHAFDKPQKLIEKIERRDELSAVIAKLVHMTGARIHEVRTMNIGDVTIAIKGKGGKKRVLDFSYRLAELAEIRKHMAKLKELSKGVNWQEFCQKQDSHYQGNVKAACRSLGDEYAGAHGLRANYAQELREKLKEKGFSKEEIELIITRELGHERRSMARHYLSV